MSTTCKWLSSNLARCIVPLLMLSFALLGCNKSGVERAEVHGRVTLEGQPISQGDIRFVPTSGPVWSARIKDGAYTTAGTKGVPVGKVRVEIQAFRTPVRIATPPANDTNNDAVPIEQYLPAKFNTSSDLELEIEPGAGRVEQDFALKN